MNIELRNELYLSWPYSTGQQGHGPLIPFIIFQCSIITSKKLWIVILLLVNCYNNDSSWNKATDLHLTVVCRRGSIWQVKTRRWTWLFYKHLQQLKGELQRENKLISYERAFKMLENDMYIAGIGQAVLELLSFEVRPGNHQRGITLLQIFSEIFGNMRLVSPKMTSHLTSHSFQILKIEIFSKPFKI